MTSEPIAGILGDVRLALRRLSRTPGFTAVAIITLGLGIGASTAIFSLVNKALLRPLPISAPEQIVAVNNITPEGRVFPTFSYLNFRDLQRMTAAAAELLAYSPAPVSLSHDGVNERIWGYIVSGNYFKTLGVRPILGRALAPSDDVMPGGHPVALISFNSWKKRFGSDPGIAGREIVVNGRSFTIVGVAPPDFIGTEVAFVAEIWFPLMMQSEIRPGGRWQDSRSTENLYVAGRMAPGTTQAQVQAALRGSAAELERQYPSENKGKTIRLSPAGLFGSMGFGPMLGFAGVLALLVSLVLLLVCTNLANLCLARGAAQQRDIALRLALGATRWRIVRALLTEYMLLSGAGGVAGVAMAWWLTRAFARFRPPIDLPLMPTLDIDGRVLLFALGASLLTSFGFGLVPAWQATSSEFMSAVRRRSRLRSGLVVAQVGLSFVLMICGGLVLRSLQRAQTVDLGMNPKNAVELAFDLNLQGYDRERGSQFQTDLLDRVRAIPGVTAAGAGSSVAPDLHIPSIKVRIEGAPPATDGAIPRADFATVSPGYFQALGIQLVKGRTFDQGDTRTSQRVAVVSETFAHRYWNSGSPLGKRFSLPGLSDAWVEIAGVVRDGKSRTLSDDPSSFIYLPLSQNYAGLTRIVARTGNENGRLLDDVRREVSNLDPHLPVFDAQTLNDHMRLPLFPVRIVALLVGSFGSLALVLAALGIFGVVSFSVSRQIHEIGVRLALGASRHNILVLIIRRGMAPVFVGMAIGLAGSLAATALLSDLLIGVASTDPLTFAGMAALLATVSLLACYLPARQAVKTDPMVALRDT